LKKDALIVPFLTVSQSPDTAEKSVCESPPQPGLLSADEVSENFAPPYYTPFAPLVKWSFLEYLQGSAFEFGGFRPLGP
jgi:hypothetical protein